MKKKGFTLIELLAVIVVLALIALIATPIVMNVIKNASAGAAERSADNYVKAVETLIATEKLDGTPLVDGEYTIGTDGKLTLGENSYEVEVSGTKPVGGTIKIENGQVVKADTTIDYTDHTVKFENGKAEATEKDDALVLCTAIAPEEQTMFNSETFEMELAVVGVQATNEAPYAAGAVYKCNLGDKDRTFFVIGEEGSKVKLILNENLGGPVAWSAKGNVDEGPITAIEHLNSQTSGWTKLRDEEGEVNLPSYDDIKVVEYSDWLTVGLASVFYPWGYWTSSEVDPLMNNVAYAVIDDGSLQWQGVYVNDESVYGVRPVITISKENMSL